MRLGAAALLVWGVAGCGGPAGDWTAISVESHGGVSAASGILELDRSDGETLLEVSLTGEGPEGRLDATGTATRQGDTATLDLVGTWTDDEEATPVTVTGPCTAVGNDLSCELAVDDEDWMLELVRERG